MHNLKIGDFKDTFTPETVQIAFTKIELQEYYRTIRNNYEICDSFKLRVANAILDMK